MKRRVCAPVLILISAVLLSFIGIVGCESDDDDDGLEISPTSVNITGATNVAFSASGGAGPYSWSVDDAALGTVVGADDTAIYSSSGAAGQNFVIVTDSQSNSVSATVTQN